MSIETILQALGSHRRVFPAWSIDVPGGFEEEFIRADQYWHAWTDDASISLTSVVLCDDAGPVPATRILEQLAPALPKPWIDDRPEGLPGFARIAPTDPPARAGRFVQGITAIDGRLLLATVTSDDVDWARATWRSIRGYAMPFPSLKSLQRAGRSSRRRRLRRTDAA